MSSGKGKSGAGRAILLLLSAAAVLSLLTAYVRNMAADRLTESLPARQAALQECRDLAAQYSALKRRQVNPDEKSRYVRTLMEEIARELNIRSSLRGITEHDVPNSDKFIEETRYTAELKNVSMENVAMFLYRIQTSGKNLMPVELNMNRHKDTDKWTAHIAVHVVSVLK